MRLREIKDNENLSEIKNLYVEAFPAAERKPFDMIIKKRDEGFCEILAIENDIGLFCGLAITVKYKDMVLLDYFAVLPGVRGGGIGSAVLGMLKERYAGKCFFLEIETVFEDAPNIEQRIRRKDFYLRNAMKPMNFIVDLIGVHMEILTSGGDISYDDYYLLYDGVFGNVISQKVHFLRRIENKGQ